MTDLSRSTVYVLDPYDLILLKSCTMNILAGTRGEHRIYRCQDDLENGQT